ncbi:hypothetical protein HOLleu_22644 [Holothuria leucospilota]|uniref:Ig-like domain-containing protein n=1 Tax=Holothuria leucospilota TaxID=206669 RepID=A0A9Q1BZE8_HOLLE|nr:hypothetical protein HOLleu_22644 [Holothuria leucospilota]
MCVKYKEDILPMLVFCTSIFLSITTCETAIVCPNVSIEKESSRAISCQSDRAISDFYWYRGNSSSAPILLLDNEGKAGAEYGSEHYDISSNGSMILKNVQVEHESYYSFVGYYENRKFGRATFLVNVTISPDPPCPLIRGCNACIECDFFELKKEGTLTCEIKRARPLLPLVWNIASKKGIDFVRHHANEERNPESDSWDTSVSLDYTIEDPCGVIGEVKCVAEDPSNILQSRISTVNIKTGNEMLSLPSPHFTSFSFSLGYVILRFTFLLESLLKHS